MNKAYSNKALPAGTILREWRLEEVLGVGDLSPQDDFFDLGGHSLISIRLINRVRAGEPVGIVDAEKARVIIRAVRALTQDHGDLVRFRNIWYRPLKNYDEQ